MRSIIAASLGLMMAAPVAMAGQRSATLRVGVTVVAACPPGSGHPCKPAAASSSQAQRQGMNKETPIAVIRDQERRMVTIVY